MCLAALATRTTGPSCHITIRKINKANLTACRSPENGRSAAAVTPEIAREGEGRWGVYLGMRGDEVKQLTGLWWLRTTRTFGNCSSETVLWRRSFGAGCGEVLLQQRNP